MEIAHYQLLASCYKGRLHKSIKLYWPKMLYLSHCFARVSGTLLRRMENGLRGVSHIIVDEIHERDLNVRKFKPAFMHLSLYLYFNGGAR